MRTKLLTLYHDIEQNIDSKADKDECRRVVKEFLALEKKYNVFATYNPAAPASGNNDASLVISTTFLPASADVRCRIFIFTELCNTVQRLGRTNAINDPLVEFILSVILVISSSIST